MAGRDVIPFFESTKYTLMRINHFSVQCPVFENNESVNGLESRQIGGVLRVMLLRENDNGVNLEETDDRNELNEELLYSLGNKQ